MESLRVTPLIDGFLTRKEMVRHYAEKSGRPIKNFSFYYWFGLFRPAVIAQQIYYRDYHGQTKDERFKALIQMVTALDNRANRIIDGADWG